MHFMKTGKALNKHCRYNKYPTAKHDNEVYVNFSVTVE